MNPSHHLSKLALQGPHFPCTDEMSTQKHPDGFSDCPKMPIIEAPGKESAGAQANMSQGTVKLHPDESGQTVCTKAWVWIRGGAKKICSVQKRSDRNGLRIIIQIKI